MTPLSSSWTFLLLPASIELAEGGASRYGAWALRSLSESLFSDDFRASRDGTSAGVVPVALARYFARDWDRSRRGPGSK